MTTSSLFSRILAAAGFGLLILIAALLCFVLGVFPIMGSMSRGMDVVLPGWGWLAGLVLLTGYVIFKLGVRLKRVLQGTVPAWSWPTFVAYGVVVFALVNLAVAMPFFFKH